jgi:2-C-methyl-D-erythritol 4-phosphate cytidylyltransferase / 2-C-methyl-D-erythritol 2,4-cyclodiphosphate synthase
MVTSPQFFALIPCGGTGSRAGTQLPKQYQPIAGQPMVAHTLAAFAAVPRVAQVLVVIAADDVLFHQLIGTTVSIAACAGNTRASTVLNGLKHLLEHTAQHDDWVLVHDAARCLLTPAQINTLIDACHNDAVGGLLALPLPDTLKSAQADQPDRVAATVARTDKWLAHTPQMFRIGALIQALEAAGDQVTDESSAMELAGHAPRLVPSSAQNFKVTYPEDFALAEAILRSRKSHRMTTQATTQAEPAQAHSPSALPPFSIGQGWDTHALVAGRKLMLGGVQVPYDKGLLGHSDADVLLHAITDALFGAAGLGDIGRHFPDTDPQFKGADSIVLLQAAARRVRAAGWQIGNIDSTIIAQAPKLAPHIPAMCERIAAALGVSAAQVNVKAKTAEKMGPVGEGLSMEANAIVLLIK